MFETTQKVLFRHCDPAGIVFFPRAFEMANDCVEAFFADALDWPFETLLTKAGVPTAAISTTFRAPSRHGDVLTLRLAVTRVGATSLGYAMEATCGGQARFATEATIVHVDADGRPARWPDAVRARLTAHLEETA